MSTIIAIDQSLSKCFYTVSVDDVVVEKGPIKTGSIKTAKHLKSVRYFDDTHEQIHYICNEIGALADKYKPDLFVFESLSFGSVGDATRDLASLIGAIVEKLMIIGYTMEYIKYFSPQTVKSFARKLLPEDKQTYLTDKGKKNLVKMDKKLIVEAVTGAVGKDYLSMYKMSGENGGLDDCCDSWVLLQLGKEHLKNKS